jgi:hypothetical protein
MQRKHLHRSKHFKRGALFAQWRRIIKSIPLKERWDLRRNPTIKEIAAFGWFVEHPEKRTKEDVLDVIRRIRDCISAQALVDEIEHPDESWRYENGNVVCVESAGLPVPR